MEQSATILKTSTLLCCLITMVSFSGVHAQDPDDQFWSGDFSTTGASGVFGNTYIWEAQEAPEGFYVSGIFVYLDGQEMNGIAYWDGSGWQSLGGGLTQTSSIPQVYAMYLDGTKLYVGGSFDMAGDVPVSNIAVWDTETKEWSALAEGVNSTVYSIIVEGDNMYAGGTFSQAGGSSINRVARWNGTDWFALGTGMNSTVYDLEIKDGLLYAAGSFSTAGGNAAARLAAWNGTTWNEFEGGTNSTIYDMAFIDTSLYIGGSFSSVDGNAATRVARWDGSSWNSFPTGPDGSVYKILDSPDGVIITGYFSQVGISNSYGMARWNGSAWESSQDDLNWLLNKPAILDMVSFQGEQIIVGAFDGSSTEIYNHIGRLGQDLSYSAFSTDENKFGINGAVYASDLHESTGDLYVGGVFRGAGGQPTNSIVRWTGTEWANLGEGISGTVYTILSDNDVIYVGGSFSEAGGVATNNIAGYDINTESWFALGSGTNNIVRELYKVGDNLFVGGSFTSAGGSSAMRIARWNTGTESWSALSSGVNNTVLTLAESGGLLLAGGSFTTAGGSSAGRLASWNGTSWSEFQGGASGTVWDLQVDGSTIYAAGDFNSIGGTSVNNIAMWDGSAWEALGPGLDDYVVTLKIIGDTLYAGGVFENAGVTEMNNVAGWDGTAWFSLGSGIEQSFAENIIYTLSADESNLYVGGQFFEVGDKTSTNFAVWDLTRTPVSNEIISGVPEGFLLNQNYPNPFNPSTTISYTIPNSGTVTLKVYNLMGQEMATLVDGVQSAGDYSIDFDASGFSSGVYFYQLFADGATVTKRMTLIK